MLQIKGHYAGEKEWFLSHNKSDISYVSANNDGLTGMLITAEFTGTAAELHQLGLYLIDTAFEWRSTCSTHTINGTAAFPSINVVVMAARTVRVATDSEGCRKIAGTVHQLEQLGQHLIHTATRTLAYRATQTIEQAHVFQTPRRVRVKLNILK